MPLRRDSRQRIWARCTTCAGALREWANFVTAACSSAVRSRKQTRAMSDLRQKAVIIPLNMPDEPLSRGSLSEFTPYYPVPFGGF